MLVRLFPLIVDLFTLCHRPCVGGRSCDCKGLLCSIIPTLCLWSSSWASCYMHQWYWWGICPPLSWTCFQDPHRVDCRIHLLQRALCFLCSYPLLVTGPLLALGFSMFLALLFFTSFGSASVFTGLYHMPAFTCIIIYPCAFTFSSYFTGLIWIW